MATVRPLAANPASGNPKAITPPDTIDPLILPASGAVPVTVANGVTFAMSVNSQAFARLMVIQPSGEVTIPADSELVFA